MKKDKNVNEVVEEIVEFDDECEEVQEEKEEVKKKDWKKIGKKVLKWTLLGAAGLAGVILVNAIANGGEEDEFEGTETETKSLGDLKTYEARIECYESGKEDIEDLLGTELKEVQEETE